MSLRVINSFLGPLWRAAGLEVGRYRSTVAGSRCRLLQEARVGVVFDVGAHSGEYAAALRRGGYTGRIVSLEPLHDVLPRLERRAAEDPAWDCLRCAAGDADTTEVMHVAGNRVSSSLSPILPRHVEAAPESATVRTETVPVRRLDSVGKEFVGLNERIAVKLDVQGHEGRALRGAEGLMDRVYVAEVELSTVRLYEGQSLAHEVIEWLYDHGLRLVNVQRGLLDGRGRALQFDGLFERAS